MRLWLLLLGCALRLCAGASVFSMLLTAGDVGAFGSVGPEGRSGATAVSSDDSRVLVFGGRADNANGDLLNDLWLYDWETGAR
jgi:hypothetical protein